MTSTHLVWIALALLAIASSFAFAQAAGPSPTPLPAPVPTTAPVVAPMSIEFKVTVNGRPIYVYDTPIASVAQFDFTQPAEVLIETTGRDVKWADIRPQRWALRPVCDGRTIRFTLQKSGKFSIELNGLSLQRPLFLFADPPEENAPKPADSGVHYFAAGQVHEAGAISVKSGETVYLAPAASFAAGYTLRAPKTSASAAGAFSWAPTRSICPAGGARALSISSIAAMSLSRASPLLTAPAGR